MLRWVQIKAHHVDKFLNESFVLAEFEGPNPMGLQTVSFPNTVDQHVIDLEHSGKRSRRPMRSIPWLLLGGHVNNPLFEIAPIHPRATGTCGILLNPGQAERCVAASP